MPTYNWPPKEKRKVIGKPVDRIDGVAKASGRIKYGSDINRPGMLHAVLVTSPYAHAKIRSIDTSEAEKSPGFAALQLMASPGEEIQWAGAEIVAIAAQTEEQARDAARKVKVDYEVLPHLVHEEDLKKAGDRVKPAGEQVTGDPDAAFQSAAAVSEGYYAIPVLAHCCLETHGQVIEFHGERMTYWPSTQNVSGIAGDLAKSLEMPAANIHVIQHAIGGGFGSKFSSDRWGTAGAQLAKKTGRPVKLFLDRATDQVIAGVRPSFYAKIKVAANKEGVVTAWQSESWATGGFTGGGVTSNLLPYVFTKIPNRRFVHSSVSINAGGARAWRAPNHPQVSYLTCAALEDLAAKMKMDPLEFFMKNADLTERPETYKMQLQQAADLIGWKRHWHPRGDSGSGVIKRGLGIGVCTWGGAGHASQCRTNIYPDGTVEVELGSQDLGTGTRTVIGQVAAESLGLPVSAIRVKIGDNTFPPSGASGGSTTVGGVSSATRKSTLNALEKLFAVVAPALQTTPDKLEAVEGRIQVMGDSSRSLSWRDACRKLGVNRISEMGENNPRNPMGLNTGGVGGIQIADVSVDSETGVVKMNKLVAVQDIGLIINPKLAESQVYGACIMSICGALLEERIMDQQIGRVLNPEMEFYKLAGAMDIGEIVVHLNTEDVHDARGVIGLGEPPVVGGIAAIANAVANAIGVRVPSVPLTPDRVLKAMERRNA